MDIKRIPSLGFYTREETAIFDFCISENQLKEEIIKSIGNILESIYKPLPDRWSLRLTREDEPYYGVVYIYDGMVIWGDINRLNTNYTALTHLLNRLYFIFKRDNIDDSLIFNGNVFNDLTTIRKMMRYVEKYKYELLSDECEFYHELVEYCIRSWEQGQKYTKDFVKNYKTYLPESCGIEVNDDLPGEPADMFNGYDCILLFKSLKTNEIKKYGTQIKGIKWCQFRDDKKYHIRVTMKIEKYRDVKFFVFYDNSNSEIYIFKNDLSQIGVSVENGVKVFSFPEKLLCKPIIKYVK